MLDFCEQSVGVALLQLVSRAQALIAELLRLSDRVPEEFKSPGSIFAPLLFDFRYFKSPDVFEERIESNAELSSLDDEFRDKYSYLLERFFQLFNGIVNYYVDLTRYLEDLQEGVYIQSTVESVLHNEDGCQLLVEALVLLGVVLILLEHRLDGTLRENLLVSYFRCKGTFDVPNFDSISTLCRHYPQPTSSPVVAVTAFLQSSPPPVPATMLNLHRPEESFSRFPLPSSLVKTVIGRLKSHDLYNQVGHYPSPDHRTTALLGQAASLYVLLYFAPTILHSDSVMMREIVDKFFRVYWVLPVFMGFTVDLLSAWSRFKAAKNAISSSITLSAVRVVSQEQISKVQTLLSDLSAFLSEGVLNQDFVLNNISTLLSCARDCNATLRWLLLHKITTSRKLRELVSNQDMALLTLLLDTSRLEFELKNVYGELLKKKESRWAESKTIVAECMNDLSAFFSGVKVLSRTIRDENLQQWFSQMCSEVNSLDYSEAVTAGRKIQHIITALEEVEHFHQIQGSLQTKQYLSEARMQLQEMIRTLNVQESTLATISVISDCSYSWGLIGEFTLLIQSQIQNDPFTVSKLQCLFLKLRSVMDIPLLRLYQSQSADLDSVSEYYSSELINYVRNVLEIVPASMFTILNGVIKEQMMNLSEIPGRFEKDSLKDYAKLDERYALAKATQRVAVFTQGIMSMKRTFIGAIELDPRQLLEEGIRRKLAEEIDLALKKALVFSTGRTEDLEDKLEALSASLSSQRQSMEYFQDYAHVHGLKLWQEEYTNIVNHNTELGCKHFLTKVHKQPTSILDSGSVNDDNFMNRVVLKLLNLTNPSKSMYLAPMTGWFNAEGQELVGLRTFITLQESLGPVGVSGIDSIVSSHAARVLGKCISSFRSEIEVKLLDHLQALEGAVRPLSVTPNGAVYAECIALISTSTECVTWVESLAHIGQLQLIRCLLSSQLRAASQLESGMVSFALEGLGTALFSTMETNSERTNGKSNGVLKELARQLQACGMFSPMKTTYITAKPPAHISLFLFLITINQLTRFVLDKHLGTLVSKAKKTALDCCPLVAGFATLLHQFHPSHSILYIQYLAQFAQAHIGKSSESSTAPQWEVANTVAWILDFAKYARVSHEVLETSVPPLVLESFGTSMGTRSHIS
ncbi:LOW QUALITY PROTEIN: WASH complex subunit 5 [Selaginella moellendorffii]|uniref:LOW QUALITY PROTEIN: WASH complex subunit 5 n=1 Tax=Selaginella moellendorffii TaxID=88036 RepID=UPI000D1D0D24|nr:LOW QUALITY PROTEIN: WASH complex subunit 5 [Selaginella moellendorffii]|eukprot:XP_024525295.1 LOW QUALITY PROTEIN: WASH complex subunit 5 [Selaginella moellendorffii]